MLKPPPKDITVPAHLTYLGRGRDFTIPSDYDHASNQIYASRGGDHVWDACQYNGATMTNHYAAPHDSEIVRANLPPLPPIPEGYDRWELKGWGGLNGEQSAPWARYYTSYGRWIINSSRVLPRGGPYFFYAIAVCDEQPAATQPEASEVDALRAAYLTLHKASGFRAGDKVRVLRKATNHEAGWDNVWDKYMDRAVGDVFAIIGDGAGGGFVLNGCGLFPWFVLELVERRPESVAMRIGDYDATLTAEHAEVGCQTIPFAHVESAYNAMCKLRETK